MKAESDYKPLPPPTADETHLNLQTKVARVKVTSSKPSKGGLVQCNVKVRPRARDRFEESYARAAQSKPDLTRGEFFEALLAAFDVKGPTKAADIAKMTDTIRTPAQPPAADRVDGRTVFLEVFATPLLAKFLQERAQAKGWTLGGTIENACAEAKEAARLAQEPCEHCKKPRTK